MSGKAFSIGGVTVDPPLLLAPMAGVTDRDFRLIIRRIGGVGVVSMEFVPSKGLVAGTKHAERIMVFSPEERPLAIQIYGSDAGTMAEAAAIVEEVGADICDINMGCPANKVLKGCAGAALMSDPALARRIVAEARRVLSIPLTVKFRLGMSERRINYLEIGRICEGEGADAVAMHCRTAKQGYSGEADWSHLARLKDELSIPVIGNGDLVEPEDALERFAETGCDGLMIGRGATRNPWLFRQIAARMEGRRWPEPTLEDRRRLVLGHFRAVAERESPKEALHKLRVFTRWYAAGLPDGNALRRRIGELPDVPTFLAAVEEHFERAAERQAA